MTNYFMRYMTTADVVAKLGLGRKRVERAVKAGELPLWGQAPGRTGGMMFEPAEVDAWIARVDAELAEQGLMRIAIARSGDSQ